ncbi:hypothetical protein C8J57DRAFT_1304485 [Mycena rebaudengoi]|nr:hypothetical protein C8J57DRAFT_1304485 [Mycena rebaudengoi]
MHALVFTPMHIAHAILVTDFLVTKRRSTISPRVRRRRPHPRPSMSSRTMRPDACAPLPAHSSYPPLAQVRPCHVIVSPLQLIALALPAACAPPANGDGIGYMRSLTWRRTRFLTSQRTCIVIAQVRCRRPWAARVVRPWPRRHRTTRSASLAYYRLPTRLHASSLAPTLPLHARPLSPRFPSRPALGQHTTRRHHAAPPTGIHTSSAGKRLRAQGSQAHTCSTDPGKTGAGACGCTYGVAGALTSGGQGTTKRAGLPATWGRPPSPLATRRAARHRPALHAPLPLAARPALARPLAPPPARPLR